MKNKPRVIAFYLPQFHPIPENDEWWGTGFTEWTNVAKARQLFKNHYQPRIPADLGFYDLRVPEVREQQAELAKYANIEGFAYWHYWFAGKRLLERPFMEVLKTDKPDFPFCLAWANESWSGIWHGNPQKILVEQTYPGESDHIRHFETILPAFRDRRYLKISNKCIFYVYFPFKIPKVSEFIKLWQRLATESGLDGIYFIARVHSQIEAENCIKLGFDGVQTNWLGEAMQKTSMLKDIWVRTSRKLLNSNFNLDIWNYKDLVNRLVDELDSKKNYFPTILTGWDNSPRSGHKGRILTNYNPEQLSIHVKLIKDKVQNKIHDENIVFLRSWNEWAEGNYVEPDLKYGRQFLDVLKKQLE